MTQTHSKILFGIMVLVFGFLIGGMMIQTAKAVSSYLVYSQTGEATTTVAYMTPGTATTTLSFNSADNEKNQLYLQLTASTSASILNWQYQFSNNNIDWFEEDAVSSTVGVSPSETLHASTTITHSWKPGSTVASTSLKTVSLPNVPAKYTRVQFFAPIGGGNSLVWAQVAQKIGITPR